MKRSVVMACVAAAMVFAGSTTVCHAQTGKDTRSQIPATADQMQQQMMQQSEQQATQKMQDAYKKQTPVSKQTQAQMQQMIKGMKK